MQTLDEDVCTLREENSSLTKHVERLTCDNDAKCLTEQRLTEQLLTHDQENQRLTELVDRLTHDLQNSQAQLLQLKADLQNEKDEKQVLQRQVWLGLQVPEKHSSTCAHAILSTCACSSLLWDLRWWFQEVRDWVSSRIKRG